MQAIQYKLLIAGSKKLKNNGSIVYSTCSLEPEENWVIVNKFLNNHKNFKVQNANKYISKEYIDDNGAVITYPPKHNIDGAFTVRLLKND